MRKVLSQRFIAEALQVELATAQGFQQSRIVAGEGENNRLLPAFRKKWPEPLNKLSRRDNLGAFVVYGEVLSIAGTEKVRFAGLGTLIEAIVGFVTGYS